MERDSSQHRAFLHFQKRFKERVSDKINPFDIWIRLSRAIEDETGEVEFVARCSHGEGRRFWRTIPEKKEHQPLYFLFDHSINCPITIYEPGMEIRTGHHRVITTETRQ